MGKSAGSAPTPPDPKVTIPLQTQANRETYNTFLQGQRYNQITPTGQQRWTRAPGTFDEAGYNAAMKTWEQGMRAPTPQQQGVPQMDGSFDTSPDSSGTGSYGNPANIGVGSNGSVVGGGNNPPIAATLMNMGSAPSREAFTGDGQWTLEQILSPNQQRLFDANESSQIRQSQLLDALSGRLSGSLDTPLDYSEIPALSSGQYNDTAADAVYGQATRYLDPQNQQQLQALEARLAEQGFVPGTPGYQRAMMNFQDTSARAYADARDRAIAAGTGFGQQQQQLDNRARSQAIAELLQKRLQPLNELNALRTGVQATPFGAAPQGGGGGVAGTDVMGAYNNLYQGQVGNYNANVGSENAFMQSLMGLGGAALPFIFSDERLKENIEFIGKTPGGANIYEYDIFGERERGVLAHELLETQPDAVARDPETGFLGVDYSKVK